MYSLAKASDVAHNSQTEIWKLEQELVRKREDLTNFDHSISMAYSYSAHQNATIEISSWPCEGREHHPIRAHNVDGSLGPWLHPLADARVEVCACS